MCIRRVGTSLAVVRGARRVRTARPRAAQDGAGGAETVQLGRCGGADAVVRPHFSARTPSRNRSPRSARAPSPIRTGISDVCRRTPPTDTSLFVSDPCDKPPTSAPHNGSESKPSADIPAGFGARHRAVTAAHPEGDVVWWAGFAATAAAAFWTGSTPRGLYTRTAENIQLRS